MIASTGSIRRSLVAMVAVALALGSAGCAKLGYSSRVLWRVPSPTGQFVAVCQEVPVLDGPNFDVRLERPDGTVIARLYQIGDGDPCSEVVWAADGRTLAVLSEHVARVRFVDVAWVLEHASEKTAHWSWRQIDFGREGQFTLGRNLRFVEPLEIALEICPYSPIEARRDGQRRCTSNAVEKRVAVPQPIMAGRS